MNKPELLAPASVLTLKTAVQSGADAVYLGGSGFGARSYAENFDNDALPAAVDYCHLRGVKVHLTLNTLIGDREFKNVLKLARYAAEIGTDAFIVQDLGLAAKIRDFGVPLHASTQLTVHNTEGAMLMKELGFKRVVLSREMKIGEIADVVRSCGIETEIFVHGALCMCYSGQCLMSSIIGGRSGNRGKCAQPCRLPYTILKNGKEISRGYYLSPKDLSLSENIKDILRTGVTSLKIEGRMKGKEYVAAAVSTFADLLKSEKNADKQQIDLLKNAFSRGGTFTNGMFAGSKNILLTNKNNDDVYDIRKTDTLTALAPLCDDTANFRKFPVHVNMNIICGKPLYAEMTYKNFQSAYTGGIVQSASRKSVDYETVFRQMSKTGDYPVYIDKLTLDTDGISFLPLSEINSVRRRLTEGILSDYAASFKRRISSVDNTVVPCAGRRTFTDIGVNTAEQYEAVKDENVRFFFAPYDANLPSADNIIPVFPDIIKNEYFTFFADTIKKKRYPRICTGNLGLIYYALQNNIDVYGSGALNIFNGSAAYCWHKLGIKGAVLSPELTATAIRDIKSPMPVSAVVYGKPALMKTAYCPLRGAFGKCVCENGEFALRDRKNEVFDIFTDKKQCVNIIYNSKPIYMAVRLSDLQNVGRLLCFTTESPSECANIMQLYKTEAKTDFPFTRGHFYRGV